MVQSSKRTNLHSVLETLPEEYREEVFDFACFLAQKKQKERGRERTLLELEGFLGDRERTHQGPVSIEDMNDAIKNRGDRLD